MKILQMIGNVAIATSIVTVAVIVSPMSAKAVSFTFNNIPGKDDVGDLFNGSLSMDVTSSSTGGVLFKFNNIGTNAAPNSYIGSVHISGALLGTSISVDRENVGEVDFKGGIDDKNLSQTNKAEFSTAYYFTKDGGASNGIQKGESLGVLFSNANFDNVISAIKGGSLRVGYHLQALPNGASDAYINNPNTPPTKPVPVPGFILGVMAAGALGGTRLLKNKKQAV